MAVRAVLAVSPLGFVAIWWISLAFHAGCAVYAISVVMLHRYIIDQNLFVLIGYLGDGAFGFFQPVIVTNCVVAACHALEITRCLSWSLRFRQWRFTGKSSFRRTFPTAVSEPCDREEPQNRPMTANTRPVCTADEVIVTTRYRCIRRLGASLKRYAGTVGIDGKHYDSVMLAAEIVEIGLQTFQAYKLSRLVSRIWINRLYAIVIILNCWSSAFVHTFFRQNLLVKRIVLLIVDSIFDVVTSMVIPVAIFFPYYQEFDLQLRDFPMVNYYHDVWLTRAISENQQVFVTSWLDFVAKVTPHGFIFTTILMLKKRLVMDTSSTMTERADTLGPTSGSLAVVTPHPRTRHLATLRAWLPTAHTHLKRFSASQLAAHRGDSVTSFHTGNGGIKRLSSSERLTAAMTLVTKHTQTWKDLLFVFAGFAVLGIHVHTTIVAIRGGAPGCMLEMRPWLSSVPTCASLEINCAHGQHSNGAHSDSMHHAVDDFDPRAIQALVLAGCASLHVPPMLATLTGIQMIKIYNSTIEQWDASAELRQDHHPHLLMVYIGDSNFSTAELPSGMLGDNLPLQLVDVEFSGTNLVKLPTNLHEIWPTIMYFVLERSPGITEFPETVAKMHIPQLMLCSNSIQSIPSGLLANQAFWKLMLDGNPLVELPDSIGTIGDLYKVGFAFTNVSNLPEWASTTLVDPTTGATVVPFLGFADLYAGGSPLCTNTTASADLRDWFVLDCSPGSPRHAYPIENEREWRALSQSQWE